MEEAFKDSNVVCAKVGEPLSFMVIGLLRKTQRQIEALDCDERKNVINR